MFLWEGVQNYSNIPMGGEYMGFCFGNLLYLSMGFGGLFNMPG